MAVAFPQYDWIVAIISIALCLSAFGNGANDVANSFATVVAARTLTMAQAGCVSLFTEFGGLGSYRHSSPHVSLLYSSQH